ncbi:Nucleoside-diphosphate-sugar pyrophosphorylase family protein [Thermanaerovibrio velox DSM 12556]|uniref:Nucleoside-diphosphate-sugar pyrophosphorylase family protein n=1 Tax=Thermanaerovibrio velox DSM 12556 TaxID=926567 RepID=H0UMU3_9BACT|nr:nucleotidyltransferase family protein [Thermanaerovibrio velox]EHM09238.1 Nucleoside-diphosphate-sugar pyrophosphorylase family protein [Thermanaerovibrio velox DSM 12556]
MALRETASVEMVCVSPETNLRRVLEIINNESSQFVLVVDAERRLVGVATDGDVRRAILNGYGLESPVSLVMNRSPKLAFEGEHWWVLLNRMRDYGIHFLIKVDVDRKVLGVVHFADVAMPKRRSNLVVIMAGGRGLRLGELTANCPKPMLPIGKKPILEMIIEKLATHGFSRFCISVNYLRDHIVSYFEDGSKMGVNISYIHEDEPLGTAGSLAFIDPLPSEPCIVMNGDIFTDLDFGALLDKHESSGLDGTVCVREIAYEIPFGVIDLGKEGMISTIREKPTLSYIANAGIYVLNPDLIGSVPRGRAYHMTQLIKDALRRGKRFGTMLLDGIWIDVGHPNDFERACALFGAKDS